MYRLGFLPIAREDMLDIVRYISQELHNPEAAQRLSERLIDAVQSILGHPYAAPAFHPPRPLKYEYRKLHVQSYMVFYRIDEERELVTVARVVYARRDYGHLLF